MLWNVYQKTSLLFKNYIDQVLNRAINYYNGALTTTYNRIATLDTEVTRFWKELTRFPGGNIASKTKVPELPTFTSSENKIHLHDWLSQIALYCLATGIRWSENHMCSHLFMCSYQHIYEIIIWQGSDRINCWFLEQLCPRTQKYLWTTR